MFTEFITAEEVEALNFASFEGTISIIAKEGEAFDRAIEYLSAQRFLGFDTETKPVFQPNTPRSGTALLQLSGETEAFLFRLNTLGLPKQLADILADPAITKIGAAVHDDIRGLQRYREFTPERFIDLQQFAVDYGIQEKSVRKMSAIILKMKVSKTQQLSNWEATSLSEAQMHYAATDAYVCLKMYKTLLGSQRVNKNI